MGLALELLGLRIEPCGRHVAVVATQLVLHGHRGLVFSITFSPDGSRLASVGADGVVRVWAVDLDELVDLAERGLTRTLTDDECRQYLHAGRCP